MGCAGSAPASAVAPKESQDGTGGTAAAPSESKRRPSILIDTNYALDFDRVINDEIGLQFLMKHAKKEFNDEMLLFWTEVMKMKRNLADASLWSGTGAPTTAPSSAPTSAPSPSPAASSAAPDLFGGGGDDDPFGAPPDDDPFGGPPDDDDAGFASHKAGGAHKAGSGSNAIIMDNTPPPEAATGDRDGYRQRMATKIIDTYLFTGADYQVTFPDGADHAFKKRTSAGNYTFSDSMFDSCVKSANKHIRTETWMRFRLTDAAQELATQRPHLVIFQPDADSHAKRLGRDPTALDHQAALRDQLVALTKSVGCERATVWIVNQTEGRLWNVCSTHLGNSILSIKLTHGLAGQAASSSADVISNDAQKDANFLNRVDKETAFKTKSVLCVVLKRAVNNDAGAAETTHAVVQLINKSGAEGSEAEGAFTESDASSVRTEGPALLTMCDAITLHQLLTASTTTTSPTGGVPSPAANGSGGTEVAC